MTGKFALGAILIVVCGLSKVAQGDEKMIAFILTSGHDSDAIATLRKSSFLDVREEPPLVEFGQLHLKLDNKLRALCDVSTKTPKLMVVDLTKVSLEIAGPFSISCSNGIPGVAELSRPVDASTLNASIISWNAKLKKLPRSLPLKAELAYVINEVAAIEKNNGNLGDGYECVEFDFGDLTQSLPSELESVSLHLCSGPDAPIGTELDAALFGHYGFDEQLSSNLDQLMLRADKERIIRFLLMSELFSLPAIKVSYPNSRGEQGAHCYVSAAPRASTPATYSLILRSDINVKCSITLRELRDVSVSSQMTVGRGGLVKPEIYKYRGKRSLFPRRIQGGLMMLLSEPNDNSDAFELWIAEQHGRDVQFIQSNGKNAMVYNEGELELGSVETIAWTTETARFGPPSNPPYPCTTLQTPFQVTQISVGGVCRILLSRLGDYSFSVQSVTDKNGNRIIDSAGAPIVPKEKRVDPGTLFEFNTDCEVLGTAVFDVLVLRSQNAIGVCGF